MLPEASSATQRSLGHVQSQEEKAEHQRGHCGLGVCAGDRELKMVQAEAMQPNFPACLLTRIGQGQSVAPCYKL